MKTQLTVIVLLATLSLSSAAISLTWSHVGNGGGATSGGAYQMQSAIGQVGASRSNGGSYQLTGGYLNSVRVIQTEGAPVLGIRLEGAQVIVDWNSKMGGWILESTHAVGSAFSPWVAVPGPYRNDDSAVSVVLPMPTERMFFRLRKE